MGVDGQSNRPIPAGVPQFHPHTSPSTWPSVITMKIDTEASTAAAPVIPAQAGIHGPVLCPKPTLHQTPDSPSPYAVSQGHGQIPRRRIHDRYLTLFGAMRVMTL